MALKTTNKGVVSHPLKWIRAVPLVGALLSVVISAFYGLPTGLIILGASVLLIAIWNLWVSLQVLAGDQVDPTDWVEAHTPSAESEQKAFLLRALEDLEYERSVGKVDEDDYISLRQSYRMKAKQVLASSGLTERRKQAEKLVEAFLAQEQTSDSPDNSKAPPKVKGVGS
ncbi:MAG: hypothetical protein CSA75_01935 [Sorangium cellulosum]|nr:MAG: hypothetical protein CSA75_01935 [Sorangium cellulosum]